MYSPHTAITTSQMQHEKRLTEPTNPRKKKEPREKKCKRKKCKRPLVRVLYNMYRHIHECRLG
jgi:hypothetical protein